MVATHSVEEVPFAYRPDMDTPKPLVEQFVELADHRCAFDFQDGSVFEGYILDILNGKVRAIAGGPFAYGEILQLAPEEIDLTRISVWSEEQNCYMDSVWNAADGSWTTTPFVPVRDESG